MKRSKRHSPFVLYAAIVSLPLLLLSCSMMEDDRSDCPDCRNTLRVMLRYDYNIQRANMFGDQVEEATVFVVDPVTGTVVDLQTMGSTTDVHPMSNPSFAFNFEGLAPGRYRLYATGRSAADAAFSVTMPQIAESIDRLQFTVPSTLQGNESMVPAQRLDTLWNTLKPIDITVPENQPAEATVPLMRLTNDLNIVIFRRDGSLDNSHNRYKVSVTDETLTLGYDNEPTADGLAQAQPLQYQPFAAWTTETTASDGSPVGTSSGSPNTTASDGSPVGTNSIVERNAHYDLSLFRLLTHDDARHNARLLITNSETGHEIVNIDLCYYLALARNAYETQHYSTQEYLDREYDYRLDFGIAGQGSEETWKYMTIRINVLSWAIRIQNEEL